MEMENAIILKCWKVLHVFFFEFHFVLLLIVFKSAVLIIELPVRKSFVFPFSLIRFPSVFQNFNVFQTDRDDI